MYHLYILHAWPANVHNNGSGPLPQKSWTPWLSTYTTMLKTFLNSLSNVLKSYLNADSLLLTNSKNIQMHFPHFLFPAKERSPRFVGYKCVTKPLAGSHTVPFILQSSLVSTVTWLSFQSVEIIDDIKTCQFYCGGGGAWKGKKSPAVPANLLFFRPVYSHLPQFW